MLEMIKYNCIATGTDIDIDIDIDIIDKSNVLYTSLRLKRFKH